MWEVWYPSANLFAGARSMIPARLNAIFGLIGIVLFPIFTHAQSATQQAEAPMPARVYPVDKRVSEMPPGDDFSRPERAYAAIHRRLVSGDSDWKAMSVARLGPVLPKPPEKPMPLGERASRGYLDARIVEVRQVSDTIAYIIAQWSASGSYDVRCVELEGGFWLNAGNNQANTIEAARRFADGTADPRRSNATDRKRKAYPQSHLQQFVDFLGRYSSDPKDFLMKSLAEHQVTIVGHVPNRPSYWRFLADAVEDPRFAQRTGVIFVQFPSNDQALVDRFFSADSPDTVPLIEMLRNADWMGCPDQAVLEFFQSVWKANQPLPAAKRVRVVLIDQQRPWKLIREAGDLRAYDVNRDEAMAHLVLRDRLQHSRDLRSGWMIVDFTSAMRNLRWRADDKPVKTAAWNISQVLGEDCFSIVEHLPQISSRGTVSGRAARGLFDSAFRAANNKPGGFALANSPFGGEPFDIATDLDCAGSFLDAFDGYLMIERIEDEYMSPIIGEFYTDDFLKEVGRRHQIVFGKSLAEELGFDEITTNGFVKWLDQTWGQPRSWKQHLGSIDAWQIGSDQPMAQ